MTRYVLPALLVALLAAGGWIKWQAGTIDTLEAENASLVRSVEVLEDSRVQARLAADVAQASLDRERTRTAEYDALRHALENGEQDVPLPEWFTVWLNDLLGGVR